MVIPGDDMPGRREDNLDNDPVGPILSDGGAESQSQAGHNEGMHFVVRYSN